MASEPEPDISLRNLILALVAAIMVCVVGLTMYLFFRQTEPTIALYGAIIALAGIMSLTFLPDLILRRILKKRRKPSG